MNRWLFILARSQRAQGAPASTSRPGGLPRLGRLCGRAPTVLPVIPKHSDGDRAACNARNEFDDISSVPPADVAVVKSALGCGLHEFLKDRIRDARMVVHAPIVEFDRQRVSVVADGTDGR